jgi:hypothetical protein
MFKKLQICMLAALVATSSLVAQEEKEDGLLESMRSLGENALEQYFKPVATVWGSGANSGWFHTAKTYSMPLLPIGISAGTISFSAVSLQESDKSFDLENQYLPVKTLFARAVSANTGIDSDDLEQALSALSDSTFITLNNLPTVVGSKESPKITWKELLGNDTTAFNAANNQLPQSARLDLNDSLDLGIRGFQSDGIFGYFPTIPNVTLLDVAISKIPVIGNIQVGIRYLPSLKLQDGFPSVGLMGYRVGYEFTDLIPVLSKLPLIHLGMFHSASELKFESDDLNITFANRLTMLTGSLDLSLFIAGVGVYGGVGIESSKIEIQTSPYEVLGVKVSEGSAINLTGRNKMRATLGGRVSFAIFDVFGDISVGDVTTLTAGFTLVGLNGL